MCDVLDDLEELDEDLEDGNPTLKYLSVLYGIYKRDFIQNTIKVNGRNIIVQRDILNEKRYGIFRGKQKTFHHIVTKENEEYKKRYFDRYRANKIHWIRPILENRNDDRIKKFEKLNYDGDNQLYFWYKEKDFIVILKAINPNLLLVTAFFVDKDRKDKYQRYYDEYRQKNTPLHK